MQQVRSVEYHYAIAFLTIPCVKPSVGSDYDESDCLTGRDRSLSCDYYVHIRATLKECHHEFNVPLPFRFTFISITLYSFSSHRKPKMVAELVPYVDGMQRGQGYEICI
jgi:hypothetical protein